MKRLFKKKEAAMFAHRILSYRVMGTVILGLLATSSPATSNDQSGPIARRREREVRAIQRVLTRTYGENTWYVFQVSHFQPKTTRSIIRVTKGISYADLVALNVTSHLETRTYMFGSSGAAAELIWRANKSPVVFVYWTFAHERDAEAYFNRVRNETIKLD